MNLVRILRIEIRI